MVHHIRRARLPGLTIACTLALAATQARAHAGHARDAITWFGEPWVLLLLVMSVGLYTTGIVRLWRHAGRGSGISRARALAFMGGSAVLLVALCSPVDYIAETLFSVHMVQHELLMVAAAPLLVLGRPLAAWTWALPMPARTAAGDWSRRPLLRAPWRVITHPLGAFGIHAAALWLWHVPALFEAALENEAMHALQHASFLFSALLFWWAVLQPRDVRMRDGVAILYLFGTMLHTGALGALLTVSTTPWYATATDAVWGLSGIEDQQIGGLIMWIPAGTVYIAAALWLMARWLTASARGASAAYASITSAGP